MRVVKPGRGNSLVRIHHCGNSFSLFPARHACPARKAVTVGQSEGPGLAHRTVTADQRPPAPWAVRSGIEERISQNSAQRRPPVVPDDMRVHRGTTTPRHRPTNPATEPASVGPPPVTENSSEQHRPAYEGWAAFLCSVTPEDLKEREKTEGVSGGGCCKAGSSATWVTVALGAYVEISSRGN